MPVTYNNRTVSNLKSFDHICSGEDRYLIVWAQSTPTGADFEHCYYGGVEMQMLYEKQDEEIAIWGLANPKSGQNTVLIEGGTLNTGGDRYAAIATSYNGVCATTPTGTVTGESGRSTHSNVAVSCPAGDMVASWCTTIFADAVNPGTLRAKVQMSYGIQLVADKAGPVTAMNWSNLYADNNHHSLDVPLKSAAPHITDVQLGAGTTLGHETVYITGRNFTGATSVKFGDAAASFNVNSDTQITVTTPPHDAGQIIVSVETLGGIGTFSSFEFISPIPANNTDAIKNMHLNEKGILYTSGAATRSGVVSARFFVPSDDGVCLGFTPRYGLIVNYYQESTYDVATREGIDQSLVTTDISQDNGIFAIYSPYEVDGAPGIVLYYYKEGKPVRFLSAECTLPVNAWHWLKMSFIDGHLQVFTRNDNVVDWTPIIDTVYREEQFPWQPETFGRSGIYLENVTSHVDSFPFYSDDVIVPFHDYSILGPGLNGRRPEAENVDCMAGLHIKVDDEIIVTEGYSLAVLSADDTTKLTVKEVYYKNDSIAVFSGHPINVPKFDLVNPNNFYNGCALIMTSGNGGGKAFRISGYQRETPNKWVPSGTYILPDTWQDHIGVAGHGTWVASDTSRIFVTEDVDGLLTFDDTTVVQIVPGLWVTTRGHDSDGNTPAGSAASTHDASIASVYTTKAVLCNWANFYTCDADWTLESIIRYVVEGSGGKCSFGSFVDGNINTTGTWGLSPWYGSDALSLRSFVANFTLPSMSIGDEVGMVFHSFSNVPGETGVGYRMTIQLDANGYWAKLQKSQNGTFVDVERMPIAFTPQGNVLISVQNQVFSMWVNGLLVASFNDLSINIGPYVAFTSKTAKTFHVRIGELCDFISMWAIDASSNANQVLNDLISDRRVYFSDAGNGGLFFYRVRRNAGTMPDIGISYQLGDSSDVVSWTRGEGAKFIEDADDDLLKKYGLRYMLVNTRWALNVDETIRFARWFRKDQAARAGTTLVEIIPHPAYQVGDYITINFPTQTKIVDLIGTAIRLEVTENNITCDEQLEGIGHASI